MRVPKDPDELWRRDGVEDEEEEEGREVPPWVTAMANAGIAIALVALLITPIALVLLYLNVQPYANILIVAAMFGALAGMALGFWERIAKAGEIRF